MGILRRHEHDVIAIKMVLGKIGTVPHLHKPILIESNQTMVHRKSTQFLIELVEPNESLTQDIKALLVSESLGVNQSIGDVLSEDLDILVVGAEILVVTVLGPIRLDDRLSGGKSIVVCFLLFFLTQFGVIGDNVLLCQIAVVVLIDLVLVVTTDEGPILVGNAVAHTAHITQQLFYI